MNKIANKSIGFSLSTEIIKIQAISTEMKRKLIGTLLFVAMILIRKFSCTRTITQSISIHF
jgi:hypothetical protein